MSWIKRNLYFLVSGAIAVALLGFAGYYFYSKWSLNREMLDKLNAAYSDWERISMKQPNAGNEKVDNIKLARQQQAAVRQEIQKVERYLTPIPPIPNPSEGGKEDFATLFRSALRRTLDELQRDAANSGVSIPAKYNFSFEAERSIYNLNAAGLPPLAVQLGEIRAICSTLFKAKVNSLEALRRERVSSDDAGASQSDYLDPTHVSITNDLAVIAPYEITFRCFSAELAGVLSGFASGNRGLIVKAINIEPVGLAPAATPGFPAGYPAGYPTGEGVPGYPPPGYPAPVAAPTVRGGLPTVLDEKPLKVTLVIDVVRLLPKR